MTELERRCVDVLTSEPFCYTEGRGFDALAIVRAVLAEAGVDGLPSCAGVVAYDRDECTITFALNTEQQVADVVAAYPHRNRIRIEATQ